MLLADYHTHTRLSPDSSAEAVQMAEAARRAGLGEYCFTDHVDFLGLRGERESFGGWAPYAEQFRDTVARTAPGLTLRLGVELGEAWEDPAQAREVAGFPEVDFIIGSVHNLSSELGGVDLYFGPYESDGACHETLAHYLDCMARLAEMDCYDVLGHIIYPLRYMNRRDGNHADLKRHFPKLEGILRTAIGKGKGIEVNTCRGETVEDWREVLGLYRDCGGEIVTLGSDAHCPEDVGKGIPEAAVLLRTFGFRLTLYEKRQPRLVRL